MNKREKVERAKCTKVYKTKIETHGDVNKIVVGNEAKH